MIRVHPEGRLWVGGTITGGVVVGLLLLLWGPPFWVSLLSSGVWLIWTGFVFSFFRYPKRICPSEPGVVYAPCDGEVVEIKRTFEPRYFHEEMLQVSVFMSPFNVHVNWAPAPGVLRRLDYMRGTYLVAWHPKASLLNEQTFMAVEGGNSACYYGLRQIAGIMARRISTYPKEGMSLRAGQEIGFIKFGSRVEVLLPLTAQIRVRLGDKVRGALTPIAQW
ncbi:MAG: phosphatidylserine decarboxylase [Bacteroidia bacterium]|nr:phosphatidylserine decarboxylase [Bacteroidia bacterium]MDW8014587.1 phosphatidylserine decarboxylase [Bacteroidia bacterium]